MNRIGRLRALALLAVATAGLMAGHSLTYLRLAPSPSGRESLLEATGHGYLDRAMVIAGALAVMSGLFWMATGAMKSRFARPTLLGTSAALAAIQILGFGIQEVLERLVTGAPLHSLGAVLLIGVPVQLMVAAAGALLVAGLHRVGARIARAFERFQPAKPAVPLLPIVLSTAFTSAVLPGGLRSRGPPQPSS